VGMGQPSSHPAAIASNASTAICLSTSARGGYFVRTAFLSLYKQLIAISNRKRFSWLFVCLIEKFRNTIFPSSLVNRSVYPFI
jgi:hypothetical protein